jgi:hypothetical protein
VSVSADRGALMAAKLGLVLDCADPDRLAAFWSAAIGYTTLGGAGNYVPREACTLPSGIMGGGHRGAGSITVGAGRAAHREHWMGTR